MIVGQRKSKIKTRNEIQNSTKMRKMGTVPKILKRGDDKI